MCVITRDLLLEICRLSCPPGIVSDLEARIVIGGIPTSEELRGHEVHVVIVCRQGGIESRVVSIMVSTRICN